MTKLSTGWLSQLENGLVQPSEYARDRIQSLLGMVLPAERPATPEDDEVVARLGACLGAVHTASITELARAAELPEGVVRIALRQLSEQLHSLGMRVFDDGQQVALGPRADLRDVPVPLTTAPPHPALTQLQSWAMVMAVCRGTITVAEMTDLRTVNSWALVQSLVAKGYLVRVGDGFQATHLFLERVSQAGGPETVEELRAQMLASVDDRYRAVLADGVGSIPPPPEPEPEELPAEEATP